MADGTSALRFVNSWADLARGLPVKVAPFFDRTLLRARPPPTRTFHHVEFEPSRSLKNSVSTDVKPSTVSVFNITPKQLNTLKSKINENASTKFSTYCILTAHIWRCATKARDLVDDQPMKLIMQRMGGAGCILPSQLVTLPTQSSQLHRLFKLVTSCLNLF